MIIDRTTSIVILFLYLLTFEVVKFCIRDDKRIVSNDYGDLEKVEKIYNKQIILKMI